MAGEEGRIVARLEPASQVKVGQEAELWVDASKVHLFDPEDGRNLTTDAKGPVRRWTGQGEARARPEVAPPPAEPGIAPQLAPEIAGGRGRRPEVAGDGPAIRP